MFFHAACSQTVGYAEVRGSNSGAGFKERLENAMSRDNICTYTTSVVHLRATVSNRHPRGQEGFFFCLSGLFFLPALASGTGPGYWV